MKRLLQLARTPFARDSAILQGSGLTIAALQLFSTVAIANLIGDVEQGTYFLALSVYGLLFMLMNTGVMQATVVQLASGAAAADTEQVAAWQAFLIKLYLLAGVLLLGVGWFALPWGAEVFLHDREAGELALILTALPFLELPRVVAQATFQSVRRMHDLAKLELINEIARVALVVGLAASFGNARGPVLGTAIAGAVGSLVGVGLYRRAATTGEHKFPSIRAILSRVRDVPIRRGLWLGVRVGSLRSIDAITVQVLPPLIIASAGGLAGRSEDVIKASVAHFRIAQRV
ncbi:MAG: oligosaccharide flippase family protein, partial [Planctomycetota bacterium]